MTANLSNTSDAVQVAAGRPGLLRMFPDFALPQRYAMPRENPAPEVTAEMKAWIRVLFASVCVLLLATVMHWRLEVPAILTALLAGWLTMRQRRAWLASVRQVDDCEVAADSLPAHSRAWILPALALGAAVATAQLDVVFFALATAPVVLLSLLSSRRMLWESRLDRASLPQREFWLPLAALAVAVVGGAIPGESVGQVIDTKAGVIAFILAFAMTTEGLGRTGYIDYLAYHIAERCRGRTERLVIYFFLLASAITVVTSNDIVVLALTPIVVALAVQTRIRDMRMMLIFMFIGANTTSMLLIFGSPTNLIFAGRMGINGLAYTVIMLVPTVVAVLVTYVMLDWIVGLARPDVNDDSVATSQRAVRRPPARVVELVKSTPLGVAGFGMFFFALAQALAASPVFGRTVQPIMQNALGTVSIESAVVSTVGSGLSVNVINDLPASALWSEILSQVQFDSQVSSVLATMGVLVGVNIGTYVTPIGALAGIIWLRLIRQELRRRRPASVDAAPTAMDLVRTALPVFVVVSVVTALVNLLVAMVLYLALQPTGINKAYPEPSLGSLDSSLLGYVAVGLIALAVCVVLFRRAVARREVVFTHISEAFLVIQGLRRWAREHRVVYASSVVALVMVLMAAVLWQLERMYEISAGVPAGERTFESLGSYGAWLMAFVGSGFENDVFPKSIGATIVAGLLPLVGIAAIVFLLRLPNADPGHLGAQLARGMGTVDRTIIIGSADAVAPIVSSLTGDSRRLFVFLYWAEPPDVASLGATHSIVCPADGAVEGLVAEYDFLSCSEIIVTSDGSEACDHTNLRILGEFIRHSESERGSFISDERRARVLFEVGSPRLYEVVNRSVPAELEPFIRVVEPSSWLKSALTLDALGSVAELGWDLRDLERQVTIDDGGSVSNARTADDGMSLWVQVGEPELDSEALLGDSLGVFEGHLDASALRGDGRVTLGRYGLTLPGRAPEWHPLLLRRGRAPHIAEISRKRTPGRIHVIGASTSSVLFVETILQSSDGTELFVHYNSQDEARDRFRQLVGRHRLHVNDQRFRTPEHLVDRLFPPIGHDEGAAQWALRPGDKVYFFQELVAGADARDQSEASTLVPVISAISRRLDQSAGALNHDSVYMVTESHRESTRFLLRRLKCDWVLDVQQRRKNFYRAFTFLYWDRALDFPNRGQSTSRFLASVELSRSLQLVQLAVGLDDPNYSPMTFGEHVDEQVRNSSVGAPIPLGVLSVRRSLSEDAMSGSEVWAMSLALGESMLAPDAEEGWRVSHSFCSISL